MFYNPPKARERKIKWRNTEIVREQLNFNRNIYLTVPKHTVDRFRTVKCGDRIRRGKGMKQGYYHGKLYLQENNSLVLQLGGSPQGKKCNFI